MAIVGHPPESGTRIDVERPRVGGPPWSYRGEAATNGARFALVATVGAVGTVSVELSDEAPPGLAEKARLIVRAAWKHAQADGAPPPRHIVRWRPGE
jgi:hypothetical protein